MESAGYGNGASSAIEQGRYWIAQFLASMPVFSVNLGQRLKFLNPGDPEALEALDRLSRRTLQALKNDQSVAGRHVGIIT